MRGWPLLLVMAACAKSADELSPFPCADDLTCPAGLACVAGQCAHARIDSICTVGSDPTDCSAAAPGAVCSAAPMGLGSGSSTPSLDTGACELPCGAGCPPDRACSDQNGAGVCLVDCNGSSTVCPQDTYCLARPDGHKVCMPPAIGCRALENATRCTARLCDPRSVDVLCPDSVSTCPADSTCSSNSRACTCDGGREAYDCTDMPCNNACGGSRSYWCAPNLSLASCTSDLDGIQATCQCWRGTIVIDCDRAGVTCDELCRDL
jgi:hypothetical protein